MYVVKICIGIVAMVALYAVATVARGYYAIGGEVFLAILLLGSFIATRFGVSKGRSPK
jgi:hypothetical protein